MSVVRGLIAHSYAPRERSILPVQNNLFKVVQIMEKRKSS